MLPCYEWRFSTFTQQPEDPPRGGCTRLFCGMAAPQLALQEAEVGNRFHDPYFNFLFPYVHMIYATSALFPETRNSYSTKWFLPGNSVNCFYVGTIFSFLFGYSFLQSSLVDPSGSHPLWGPLER